MRRYWLSNDAFNLKNPVSGDLSAGDHVRIVEEELHHIRDVCRMGVGSKFEVLRGDSKAYLVEVISEKKKEMIANILELREIAPLPSPRIHLVVSLPRFNVLETVLEKSVELGVATFQIVLSEQSFLKQDTQAIHSKWSRWEKIVKSATQQCGRGELMPLQPLVFLKSLLTDWDSKFGLFLFEGDGDSTFKQKLTEIRNLHPQDIYLFVGGEGGYSPGEVETFRKLGLPPVTLGQQVLRVETAILAALSALKYEFDLMI